MERVFAELIRRVRSEHDLVVISSELAPDLARLVDWRRTRVPLRPAPLRFLLFYMFAGLRLRRLRRADDLVHTCGAVVPNRADLASVHFCHAGFHAVVGNAADVTSFPRRINKAIASRLSLAAERWSYRDGRTRVLAAVSEGVAAELERAYPDASVVVTPNGVDLERFRPDPGVRAELRHSRGMGTGEVVALFVGGDWHRKGLGVAVEALTGAPDVRLWVVGSGDVRGLQRKATLLGVADRVELLGTRRDVERYYQAADILLLPSSYEAFPLVSLEAAACGLPLLATRVNGVTDLIGDSEAGWILERSGPAFARALQELGSDPHGRERMGRAARRRAEAFTWEASTANVRTLYHSLRNVSAVEEVAA
jgi:glycosyltransferase involved in cell wall biosynthesis